LRAYNAAKCDYGRGSTLDPAGGAYSSPPDPLAGFKGLLCGEEGKRKWREGKRDGEGKERRGAGKERKGGRLTCTVGTGPPVG